MCLNNSVAARKRPLPSIHLTSTAAGATALVLLSGLVQFKRGDRVKAQKMMRLRVAMQGITVTVMMASLFLTGRHWDMHKKRSEKQPAAVEAVAPPEEA
jgi:formate-dependent nitrite reductase membrane component NrfD